jgi:hypothetical protein
LPLQRTGNALSAEETRIASYDGEIIMSQWDLMVPFVLTMPPGATDRPLGVYTTFLQARGTRLAVKANFCSVRTAGAASRRAKRRVARLATQVASVDAHASALRTWRRVARTGSAICARR